jgi:Spy/CpxP family protein refolding chaperone
MSNGANGRGPVATLLILGTFVLGMIAGAALLHIAVLTLHGPGPFKRQGPDGPPIEAIRHDLDLTPEQEQKIRTLLDETHERIRAEADATRDKIRELLTPEQRQRFDAMHHGPFGEHGGVRRRSPI